MLRHPLAREVAIVVAVKTAIVIAAAIFVFGPKQRPVIDAAAVEALIAPPPAATSEIRKSADE
jgi:hypothetical protein